MIIQLKKEITADEKQHLEQQLNQLHINFYPVVTQRGTYFICTPKEAFDIRKVGHLNGILDVHRVKGKHKMVSNKWKVNNTVIDCGDDVLIGDGKLTVMAGPCSIESEAQINATVESLKQNGVRIMRGGVYKPRTSPYSFRGLGMEGLKMFYNACQQNGIKIITEVMESGQIEEMMPYVDIFQVGARNAQNFNLLEALGEVDKPVMLKRGISGTIDELLYSAEYVFKSGNEKLILCERGIRTFENAYRNTLDLNAVPILKEKSHLPVIVDPSHGIGIRKHVAQMALASAAVGADGLIIETHKTPEKAATDGQQTLSFREFEELMQKLKVFETAFASS
ncbi:3-deoxy-7-phosphoheptulonate synthase [Brumimicrobium salinarum]|uniref:3-deoxy-7-phosphoheptulonate synthase n=1 Tax=Brumimicrobium salinarum TaxID=2058658 RepID=A0A2I0R6W5_9FLAO|nr:3-deoxy-7-phosphoheptulonate synthase [Brumimicrobium salinarum]PKR82326.1 3-deoxy-7-phosphoheptulonate synthase [Brumimicrobium salinarum]